jgi:predicted enzyme involved in methoxymalonyl-ACP biosynthesis
MENLTLNIIVNLAKQNSLETIFGEYVPTAKNEMVANHYAHLGFQFKDGRWACEIENYIEKETKIKGNKL